MKYLILIFFFSALLMQDILAQERYLREYPSLLSPTFSDNQKTYNFYNTQNGSLLWERVFPWLIKSINSSGNLDYKFSNNYIYNGVELQNGDLFAPIAVGRSAFIRADPDGCIEPECGFYQAMDQEK